jgi:hypothetical protein
MSSEPVSTTTLQVKAAGKVAWWQFVLVAVLTVGLVLGVVWFVRGSVSTFTHLPSGTATAIVTGSVTFLVAIVGILVSRFLERRSNREREQQEKRVPVYEEFVSGLLELMGATRASSAEGESEGEAESGTGVQDANAFLARFTERVIIWGSEDVVREWVSFRKANSASNSGQENFENLYRLESLLLVMRRDLGLRNKKLERGDLLRLWINDLD